MYINVKIDYYSLFIIVNIVMRIRRVEYSFEYFHLSLEEMNREPSILDEVNLAKQCRSVVYSFFTVQKEMWAAGVDWDDFLPEKLETKWNNWLSKLHKIQAISFPRCLRLSQPTDIQLDVFSDASRAAYAAVAYLSCKYPDHPLMSHLVGSK